MNSPDDLFTDLTIEGWTAVLVVVTALYATITLWLAVSASRSARSAERAAKAAEDTAETAERSALASEEAASASEKAALAAAKSAELAEARIDVSLAARYEERGGTQPWLQLVCEGDRVVIHGARTQGSYFGRSSGRPHSIEPKDPASKVPGFLRDMLITHLAGSPAGEWVFQSPKGGFLRYDNFRTRVWAPCPRGRGGRSLDLSPAAAHSGGFHDR